MSKMTKPNIYLFYPNLIGFGRVVLGVASLFYMSDSPIIAMTLYWLSAFLDAFDGMAARRFNQSTIFGAVLDMVSDRCTTICLLVICAQFYPSYAVAAQLIITLDIASHWFQMYSTMLQGRESHKSENLHPLLAWYYQKVPLFVLCSANEIFVMSVYLLHFFEGYEIGFGDFTMGFWRWMAYISLPMFALKHFLSIIQLIEAVKIIEEVDQRNIADRLKGK